jgi:hypothetical protein
MLGSHQRPAAGLTPTVLAAVIDGDAARDQQ